jgi:hypothetical protein
MEFIDYFQNLINDIQDEKIDINSLDFDKKILKKNIDTVSNIINNKYSNEYNKLNNTLKISYDNSKKKLADAITTINKNIINDDFTLYDVLDDIQEFDILDEEFINLFEKKKIKEKKLKYSKNIKVIEKDLTNYRIKIIGVRKRIQKYKMLNDQIKLNKEIDKFNELKKNTIDLYNYYKELKDKELKEIDKFNELKKNTIDLYNYYKELKDKELKNKELKDKELKDKPIKKKSNNNNIDKIKMPNKWLEFVKDCRKKNPKATLKQCAEEYRSEEQDIRKQKTKARDIKFKKTSEKIKKDIEESKKKEEPRRIKR